jgi:alginate O-acetyltransferase complex protein AlgI
MLFLTYWFLLFGAVLYPLYWLVPFRRARLAILLAGSAVFHTHFAGPAGVLPIAVLALATYLAGLSRNRIACGLTCLACALSLLYYKYVKFLCLTVAGALYPPLVSWLTAGASPAAPVPKWLAPVPPLAISFFTFEFIHYLVDVARGGKPIRNVRDFALFSIFWPSIVCGPVKRYQQFIGTLHQGARGVSSTDVAVGLTRVAGGLLKKLVGDILTAWIAFWGPHFHTFDVLWRWFFVVCLGFRILLDFSGYSDMAIGYARMHGIVLPENFNWPYLAESLTDFWHRWHISLSLWIRDYIYIALGGSRCGLVRKVLNGLLAFGLCGLWHGAGWNFIVWGLYHGVGLAVCSNWRLVLGPLAGPAGDFLQRHRPLAWLLTLSYVWVGWVFFFYPLPQAWTLLLSLFGGTPVHL